MYSIVAGVLVSLLLDLNKINSQSSTFTIRFENLIVGSITLACFYVVGIIFSPVRKQKR